ncbi:MAG: FtsX-like permease family protein [Thermomicrobiales bacterium]
MDDIFGLSIGTIMTVLIILLAICLAAVAYVAFRNPVVFRMGMRNIPRRRAQTVLIVIGLMLSTLIIAAAFGTGDTIDRSVTAAALEGLGEVDEVVVSSQDPNNEGSVESALNETFDAAVLTRLDQELGSDPDVDGILPVLLETLPVVSEASGQSEPVSYLVGVDPARLDQFGGLRTPDGDSIDLAATALDEVVVSESLAEALDVEVGTTLTTFYRQQPIQLRVAAIAEDSPLSGRFDTATPGWVVPLDRLQAATGQEGLLTFIAISNRGGVEGGLALSDTVTGRAREVISGMPLGVDPYKDRLVDFANVFSSLFTSLFLVLGLFSVAVGILLIVLIFTMLAAERRPEMGMARAVGQRRGQLIQQFVAEGSGYALLAGLVGAALGVLATYAIALSLGALIGEELTIDPYVSPRSLVVAYCLGVVITFIAVVGSSWKISRLNVVAAIRDLPDVSSAKRRKRTLIWAGLLLVVGGSLAFLGQTGDVGRAFFFYAGMSLMPFGVALILRYLGAPSRPVLSAVGVYLLVLWFLPASVANRLFGDLGGDFEMFFLSGIFMVAGATLVIVQNLDLLLKGVSSLGGVFQSKLPAIRTAIAYPGAAKGRTGMLIAMFSLIVFSLITFATINQNFANLFLSDTANAGWDVRAQLLPDNPAGDGSTAAFEQAIAADGVDLSRVDAVGGVALGSVEGQVSVPGTSASGTTLVSGMDDAFITETAFTFTARAEGYATDAAVIAALRNEPGVGIIDSSAIPGNDGPGGDRFTLDGYSETDDVFAPITVEVQPREGGAAVPLRIIGIIDEEISSLFGVYAPMATVVGPNAIYDQPDAYLYYLRTPDADDALEVARGVESALLQNGAQAVSIQDELEDQQSQANGFLYIIQGFMGLGLLVGVAAVGVISFRAVVERRQQIGMLRALGYQRSMVGLSMIIETLFVVTIGVVTGLVLGLTLAYQLFTSDDFGGPDADFVIPWSIVVGILVITVVSALAMTWVPSRQASRLAPAEALRYE